MLVIMLLCVLVVTLWTSASVERALARYTMRRCRMRYPVAVSLCVVFLAYYFS
jgi:hypothetical protein